MLAYRTYSYAQMYLSCCLPAATAAESELLQLHPGAVGLTPADLRAFQDLLASQ